MKRLPNELQLIIGRKVGDADWKLEVILQELVQEIEARERTGESGLGLALPLNQSKYTSSHTQLQRCSLGAHNHGADSVISNTHLKGVSR